MSDTEYIPKTKDSGSDGSQVENNELSELVESNQLGELSPLSSTIQGIATSNNRAFGSEAASAMVAGVTNYLDSQLKLSKEENSKLQENLNALNELYTKAQVDNAVLKQCIKSNYQHRHLRNIAIAIGTMMLTAVSIPLFSSPQYHDYGYVSLIIGGLLVGIAWFMPVQGGDK